MAGNFKEKTKPEKARKYIAEKPGENKALFSEAHIRPEI